MKIKLYKFKNGKWVFVDYGVFSKLEAYGRQGYIAEIERRGECKQQKTILAKG